MGGQERRERGHQGWGAKEGRAGRAEQRRAASPPSTDPSGAAPDTNPSSGTLHPFPQPLTHHSESASDTFPGCCCFLPSAPHPHALPKSLQQPGAGSRAQPRSALTAPDKPDKGWLGSASPSASTWIRPLPVLFAHPPHGNSPHNESRWPPCSSQVGSPVSCSLKVSLFLQPIGRLLTAQMHLLGCSFVCGSTDIPRARILPAAGKPLLTLGCSWHLASLISQSQGNFRVFSCSFRPQDAVGVAEPSASLGSSSLMGVPSGFLAMAGAASLTTNNLQVFKHLHSLTLPYIHSFGWAISPPLPLKPHPRSCPGHGTARGAHSLHLPTSRDHLDLQGPPQPCRSPYKPSSASSAPLPMKPTRPGMIFTQ